jgi:uncharacterized protein
MPLIVNLRRLESGEARLTGSLDQEELDIETRDDVIRVGSSLAYDITVEKMDAGVLVHGRLGLKLDCQCVRCLKPFRHELNLDHWTCHVPLEGEDASPVVNDSVDLTPYAREDILLEFPQHPLCDPECEGLPRKAVGGSSRSGSELQGRPEISAWDALDKLKFDQ